MSSPTPQTPERRVRRGSPLLSLTVPVALVSVLLGGCSGPGQPSATPPSPSSRTTLSETTSPGPTPPGPTPPGPTPPGPVAPVAPAPTSPYRVSLPTLMSEEPDGGRPRILQTLAETDDYTRYAVSYRSGTTTVSGVLLRPRGRGPFPGVVLNHGYIEPSEYVTGQGLAREQDALARDGFVVLHTDYRGHASGDPAGRLERESRLGYVRDAVNAVDALLELAYVDPDRLAMLGRSMGGGVTLGALVAHPGLVDAAVVHASVSSDVRDNLRQFTEPGRPAVASELYRRFGTPQESPGFYDGLSPRTYVDRVTEPVLALHGSVDATCPPGWARDTHRAMRAAGVEARLRFLEGEDHSFYDRWQDSMDLTIRFLRAQLEAD